MRFVFGVLAVLIGTAILVWIGYNLLIQKQPEFEGQNPVIGIVVSLVLISVGIKWLRG